MKVTSSQKIWSAHIVGAEVEEPSCSGFLATLAGWLRGLTLGEAGKQEVSELQQRSRTETPAALGEGTHGFRAHPPLQQGKTDGVTINL
jgi:hypothetical protein